MRCFEGRQLHQCLHSLYLLLITRIRLHVPWVVYLRVVGNLAAPARTQIFNGQTEIGRSKLEDDLFGFYQQSSTESLLQLDYVLYTK